MTSGDAAGRPVMRWIYEDPVAPEDVLREAAKDDVPTRFHEVLFGSGAPREKPEDAKVV